MAYTHNFQIVTGNINIEGELNFNGSEPPKLKFTNNPEMEMIDWHSITDFFIKLKAISIEGGGIQTIEISEKV